MKSFTVTFALFAAIALGDVNIGVSRTETVSIQSVDTHSSPIASLAEVQYDAFTLRAEYTSFDAPELPSETKLVRIGIYNEDTKSWQSSTSVLAANSFNKGYTQTIILSLDAHGDILGVSCRSVKIDAGQTRDFSPKVKVVKTIKGKTPELNRPIIASKDGTTEGEEPEKTFFQKYWWVIAGGILLLLATGGGEK